MKCVSLKSISYLDKKKILDEFYVENMSKHNK